MTTETKRIQAVSNAVGRIRKIEKEMGANYDGLKKIRDELVDLTRDKSLFPRDHFPLSESGESAIYRLSEDEDHRFALYGSAGAAGKSVPPHNHTTWAVIVGVHGDELNRFYEQISGQAKPGHAVLEETGRFVVQHGNGVCFMPNDVHSISTDNTGPTLHLHMYGLALDHLDKRLVFDQKAQKADFMPLKTDIHTPLS